MMSVYTGWRGRNTENEAVGGSVDCENNIISTLTMACSRLRVVTLNYKVTKTQEHMNQES